MMSSFIQKVSVFVHHRHTDQLSKSIDCNESFRNQRCSIRVSCAPAFRHSAIPVSQMQPRSPPIMVIGCTGKMGKAVIQAAIDAGIQVVPGSFSHGKSSGRTVMVGGKEIHLCGVSEREGLLTRSLEQYPGMIVVDYTMPDTVIDNAELYCKVGANFVMGTTGGDRERLYKAVERSNVYAVISPQMGKQVVAFLAAMEFLSDQFPGAFSNYRLKVIESHQESKLDTSGTAVAVVSCFNKLGADLQDNKIQKIRDAQLQVSDMGVPEEHVGGHAFHTYHLQSPDMKVSFEFQHNVCGRSIYAEGTIDAVLFLSKMAGMMVEKRIYDMVDVLRAGNMR